MKIRIKSIWTLPFSFACFVFCPAWGAELTPAETVYQKILNADAIQQVTYEDVRGIGEVQPDPFVAMLVMNDLYFVSS